MAHLINSRTDWTPEILQDIYGHIEDVALNDLKLDVYPNQIEIISAEQMIDAYASVGMPVNYHHWSFGKQFMKDWTKYQKGHMGLAYEIVINSNPCIAYLMEENSAIMQALVIAHASFGHNAVFKNNFAFKENTSASSIIDYMLFAKNYIADCERKYGEDEVELLLDAAHTITSHGVDKRKRKHVKKLSEEEQIKKNMAAADEEQLNMDIIIQRTSFQEATPEQTIEDLDLAGDEENLLYFIYKQSPYLKPWQREILRIVHKIQQYFYPQRQTQVVNEGFATFTHYNILNELEERGIISDDAQIAWLHSHTNVIFQPDMHSKYYTGNFNPYALGFAMFQDIKRICENPTREDEEWFPDLVGTNWREATKLAMSDYRDESFIEQFMSPTIIRKFRAFSVDFNRRVGVVREISDDLGYRDIRRDLASSYSLVERTPDIVVHSARMKGDRTLTLEYRPYRGRSLHGDYAKKVLEHVKLLWGYPVEIVSFDENGSQRIIQQV